MLRYSLVVVVREVVVVVAELVVVVVAVAVVVALVVVVVVVGRVQLQGLEVAVLYLSHCVPYSVGLVHSIFIYIYIGIYDRKQKRDE